MDEYRYLRQSNYFSISRVDDAERFHSVVEAMNVVYISKEDQDSVFAMLAAVLWLGNISFTVADNENYVEVVPDEGLQDILQSPLQQQSARTSGEKHYFSTDESTCTIVRNSESEGGSKQTLFKTIMFGGVERSHISSIAFL